MIEVLILKNIKSFELFKKKIKKGQLSEKDIFLYERSQNGNGVCIWECKPTKKHEITNYNSEKRQLIFFGIVEGRDYVERGIFNTENVIKKAFV